MVFSDAQIFDIIHLELKRGYKLFLLLGSKTLSVFQNTHTHTHTQPCALFERWPYITSKRIGT